MKTTLETIIEKYQNTNKDNLIPILQEIQDSFGYLSEESIIKVGEYLAVPISKIYGVATFYDQFRFERQGKNIIKICHGTSCHVLGATTVIQEFEKQLKIKAGQTTRDKVFSLEIVSCIGACGLAPVIEINGNYHTDITAEKIKELIEIYKDKIE